MSTPGSPNIMIDMNMVGLPPGMIITSSGDTVTLKTLVQVGGHRLAHWQDAGRRRVAVMAVAQRLDRRLDDKIGRAEIRLADAEIDDVLALRGKRGGARQHGKGVFLADTVEGGNGLQHGVSSRFWRFLATVCVARQRDGGLCFPTWNSAIRMTSKMMATDQPISRRPLSAVRGPMIFWLSTTMGSP